MKRLILFAFVLVFLVEGICFGATQTFIGNISGNAATVTTNANMTGDVTSVGNATTIKESPYIKAVTLSGGSELLYNWNFDLGDLGFSKGTGMTIDDQGGGNYEMVCTNCDASANLNRNTPGFVVGDWYMSTIIVTSFTDGSLRASMEGVFGPTITSTGTYMWPFEAIAETTGIGVQAVAAGSDFRIGSVSVKKLPLKVAGVADLPENVRIVIPTFANNAAAIAGGLVAGQLYRVNAATDPEPLYIVH